LAPFGFVFLNEVFRTTPRSVVFKIDFRVEVLVRVACWCTAESAAASRPILVVYSANY